jgi:phosphoribosyl-ATP pyrophosphohydrolase/phosphoribosyl-AMP cyclohydrolase
MVAYADREALERTLSTGFAHYHSRSRKSLWRKGESSGHEQRVAEIRLDCDGDTVLFRVDQTGPACHTGSRTCFSRVGRRDGGTAEEQDPGGHLLSRLAATIAARAAERPGGSYTVELLEQGVSKISQKVGEEAVELVVAANAEDDARVVAESADLLYHLLVALDQRRVPLSSVMDELRRRREGR